MMTMIKPNIKTFNMNIIVSVLLILICQIIYPFEVKSATIPVSKESHNLKNAYTLEITTEQSDSMFTYTVELKGKTSSKILFQEDYTDRLPNKYIPYYSGKDFDDYLVLNVNQGNYSIAIYLIEKSSGNNIFQDKDNDYLQSSYDLNNNILLYCYNDEMFLYDLKTQKKIALDMNDFTDWAGAGYWNYFKIDNVTDKYIDVIYFGEYRPEDKKKLVRVKR